MPENTESQRTEKATAVRMRNILEYTAKDLYFHMQSDEAALSQFPGMSHILHLYMILPFSSSSVERVFSRLKLTKSHLRSRLAEYSLDQLLRVSLESPLWLPKETVDSIVDEIVKRNPNMRLI